MRKIICTLLLVLFVFAGYSQIGIFKQVIADTMKAKDYRFQQLPTFSVYNALINITAGEQNLSTPPGTTLQRPTVPANKYVLRYNTDSAALEIGNPSQVWKTLAMSSVQSFDTSSITNFGLKVRSQFSATSPIQYNAVTGVISTPQATSSVSGYLASADWIVFNSKLPDPGSNGFIARTALGTTFARQLVATSQNISIVNPTGVSGNPGIDVNDTLTLRQLILPYIPAAASTADSTLFLNRSTGMLEIRPAASGGGEETNTRYSVTKGTLDSVQLVNDITVIPEVGKAWKYGFDSTGSRGFQEDKYVIAKTAVELRKLRDIDTSHVYRLITHGSIGDFYYDPEDVSTVDDTVMVIVVGNKRLKRYVANVIDVRWFGANPADDGGDDYPYIQNAINWCVKTRKHGTLYIPGGIYNLSRGLLVLRDDNNDGITDFVSLDIIGDKVGGDDAYAVFGNGGTTVLRLNDSTDFCIGVQKGKTMNIKNLAMVGLNLTYAINTNNMLQPGTQWTLPGIRNNRYSPNAGIVLDPFGSSSVLMANRYPLRTGNYGEVSSAGSSAINIEGCWFRGFAVGICNSPSGVVQNGEGHTFKHLWIGHVASAIANCNQQNRTVFCFDIKAWDAIEVVFDHQRYGDGTSSAMYVDNANIAGGIKWLVATTNWGIGYLHQFSNIHAESIYGIGGDITGGTQLGNISFKNSQIDLTGESIGISQRAPVIAWCNVLELQDSYMGGYSEGDGNMLFVNAAMVIRRNCTGSPVLTQGTYENNVFDELNINDGVKPIYFATGASGIANDIALKPGLELYKNGYLDFAPGGFLMKQKYCGKAMNIYTVTGSHTPTAIDSNARTATFNVGTEIYKVAPGAQIVSLLPDDITGTPRLASVGHVQSVNIGAQTFVVSRLSHKITSATTGLSIYIYQQPKLKSTVSFYIGDITSGSPTITNITGDFNVNHNMQVGQYFNHPAFISGTYITAVGGTEITLSRNAIYSETGAFVLTETSWENTGISGELQATNNSFYNSTVFKEGDIIRMGYSNNSNTLDTAKLAFVCVKSGRFNDVRLPKFKTIYANPLITQDSVGTAPHALYFASDGTVKKGAIPSGGGGGSGLLTLNTLTADPQFFAVGTAGTNFAINSSGSTHTFNIPDASASARGLITTGTQTIAGAKTFTSNTQLEGMTRMKGDADENLEIYSFGNDLYLFSINDARNSSPTNTYFNTGTNFIFQDYTTGTPFERARFSGLDMLIGSGTNNGNGRLQVTGKVTVSTHDIAANSDSALVWNRTTNEYEYAKINGGSGVTSFAFTDGAGFDGTVTNPTTTPTLSIIPSFSGLVASESSAFGAATIGNLLEYNTGTIGVNDAYMVALTSPSIIQLKSRFRRTEYEVPDANFSTLSTRQEGLYVLPDITVNRTFDMFTGSGVQGHELYIYNGNTSGTFSWSFTGNIPKKGSDGSTVTTLVNGVLYHLLGVYVGSTATWVIVNQ